MGENTKNEKRSLSYLKKFYNALIEAIVMHSKIEKLVKKYNFIAIYNSEIREILQDLSLKLNGLTCQINEYKKMLEND